MDYIANSTRLGNNCLKNDGLNRSKVRHYQAHHMMPLEHGTTISFLNLEKIRFQKLVSML